MKGNDSVRVESFFVPRLLLLALISLLTLTPVAAGELDPIVIILPTAPGTLNPLFGGNRAVNQLIWAPLFNVDPDTGALTPGLVDSWEISDDGLTYMFTIRDDFTWSDGTPITTQDIAYAVNAINSDAVNSPARGSLPPQVYETFQVLDDHHFSVSILQPNCSLLTRMNGITPLPAHVLSSNYSEIANPAFIPTINSGPFTVGNVVPGEAIQLDGNNEYWQGAPTISGVTFRIISDAATAVQALADGEADILSLTPAELAADAPENAQGIQVANTGVMYLALNNADPANPQPGYDAQRNAIDQGVHPILGDVRVRQAIAYSVDVDALIAEVEGAGTPTTGFLHPQTMAWAHNPNLVPQALTPAQRSQLLDEAGWTDEDGDGIRECHGCLYAEEGTPLTFSLTSDNVRPEISVIASAIHNQLATMGINVDLDFNNVAPGSPSPILNQDFDAAIVTLGGFPSDPSFAYDSLAHSAFDVPGRGFNLVSYRNPEVDSLLDQARTLPDCDPQARAAIYQQGQTILDQDMPYIGLFALSDTFYVSDRIQGFVPAPGQPYWNIHRLAEIAQILTVDANGNDATSPDFDPENIVQTGFPTLTVVPAPAALPAATATPTPVSLPAEAADPAACTVTANTNANLRGGPGTTFDTVGSVAAGQALTASGQAQGADGAVWLVVGDGAYIRADLADGEENCPALPGLAP